MSLQHINEQILKLSFILFQKILLETNKHEVKKNFVKIGFLLLCQNLLKDKGSTSFAHFSNTLRKLQLIILTTQMLTGKSGEYRHFCTTSNGYQRVSPWEQQEQGLNTERTYSRASRVAFVAATKGLSKMVGEPTGRPMSYIVHRVNESIKASAHI